MHRNLKLTSEQEQEMIMEILDCETIQERIHVYGQYGQLKRIEELLENKSKRFVPKSFVQTINESGVKP